MNTIVNLYFAKLILNILVFLGVFES